VTINYNDPSRITIAVQKSGRLAEYSHSLLERCGLHLARSKDGLFGFGESMPVDLLFIRDDDIPGFVADGHADFGIVGRNVAEEFALGVPNGRPPYSVRKDLSFGACRLSIAVPEAAAYESPKSLQALRIATTYPNITRRFLEANGVDADVAKLSGSVELAPRLGSADAIVDIVSTGRTLRAHHLKEVDVVMNSSAVLLESTTPLLPPLEEVAKRLFLRIDSTLRVDESKYVMLHAPANAVDRISELLPGAEKPSVLPLAGTTERVALHAVCREAVFWEHLESLKAAGASAILVMPVEKMLL
jgi:ATP phosphoribosyltransferase